jgi:hypothetical protein
LQQSSSSRNLLRASCDLLGIYRERSLKSLSQGQHFSRGLTRAILVLFLIFQSGWAPAGTHPTQHHPNPASAAHGQGCSRRPITRREAIELALQPVVLDRHVLAFNVTGFAEPLAECGHRICRGVSRRPTVDERNHRHSRLLRPRRERPCRRAPLSTAALTNSRGCPVMSG